MYFAAFLAVVAKNPDPCHTDPCYAPKAYDCPMRRLALEYANVTLGHYISYFPPLSASRSSVPYPASNLLFLFVPSIVVHCLPERCLHPVNRALSTGPSANLLAVFQDLNLTGGCGDVPPPPAQHQNATAAEPSVLPSAAGLEIFVATDGSDATGDGTIGAPYATVHKAQAVARASNGKGTRGFYFCSGFKSRKNVY